MKTVLRFPIALTPLSPIHIGCGEYYNPTEYLVKNGVLFAFDPIEVHLKPNELRELGKIAKAADTKDLALFYQKNSNLYLPMTKAVVSVASSFESNYRKTFTSNVSRSAKPVNSKTDDKIINQCLADRTAYLYGKDGLSQAYIPGSGIKGAIHTALLDRVNNGRRRDKKDNLDALVLGGTFSNSPMRLVKITDFLNRGEFTATHILEAKRVKKAFSIFGDGIPNYFECILPGQIRKYRGEITVEIVPNMNQHAYQSLKEIFADLNKYYLKRFQKEAQYEYSDKWLQGMRTLLSATQKQLDNGTMALIRVGKNSGAENMVLHEGIAKIRRGKLGESSTTTTVWKCNYDSHCVPFGWALLELSDSSNLELKGLLPFTTDNAEISQTLFDDFIKYRSDYQAQKDEQQARVEEEEKERKAKEAEEKIRQNKLNALSENMKSVQLLAEKIQATNRAVKPGTTLHIETLSLLEKALSWSIEEQKKCAELLAPLIKTREMYQGKDAKVLKARIRELKHE